MKALRVLAATVAAWATALVAQAAPPLPPASLTVSAEQGQPFGLALDGRALTWPVARQVRAGQLTPGWHRADVSVAASYGPPVRFSTRLWLEAGRDNNYLLVLRRSGPELVPVAPVAGPAGPGGTYPPAGPGYPGGTAPVPPTPGGYPGNGGNYPGSGNYPGNSGSYPGNSNYPGNGSYPGLGGSAPATPGNGYPAPGGYPATPGAGGSYPAPGGNGYPGSGTGSYPVPPMPGSYPGGSGYPAPGGYPGGGYPAPGGYYPNGGGPRLLQLTPADIARLQQSVSQRPFDDDRLSIIRQALSSGAVRADELTALVRMLTFDRSRIELAKFGYAHVSDPQNFYRVYDALQYSSSVREVQDALGLPH